MFSVAYNLHEFNRIDKVTAKKLIVKTIEFRNKINTH